MNTKAIDPKSVRPSAIVNGLPIAGTWYPGSPDVLKQTVDDYLARAEYFATNDELIALISPHAGYKYSGQTAAYAYRQLLNQQFDTVVLLGPVHWDRFDTNTLSANDYYWTPLGAIELDQEFIGALAQKIQVRRVGQDSEHSLEIQLPFLQRALGSFKLVPIMMSLPFYVVGERALEPCERLAAALADLARGKRVLFVASSDLSHLDDYSAVKKFDARTEELIAAFDVPGLVKYMSQERECRPCGDAPIITALLAAKTLGANRARVL
ncbi:MAG: AmmeMemoRadiSam system protein B, partial [Chloroflexota bacterium]